MINSKFRLEQTVLYKVKCTSTTLQLRYTRLRDIQEKNKRFSHQDFSNSYQLAHTKLKTSYHYQT